MTTFNDLALSEPILSAIAAGGYETPTPIQAEAIPPLLEGHDLMGIAQTGTGKTAAFLLPMLQRLSDQDIRTPRGSPRALVLAPTRELAGQIEENLKIYGSNLPLKSVVVYGGVPINRQIKALQKGVDILIATPGRLLDLMAQRKAWMDKIEIFVLDEADRMLDMGFLPDVKKIAQTMPEGHQRIMLSATMPKQIKALADELLVDPVQVAVAPQSSAARDVKQKVFFLAKDKKRKLLFHLLEDDALARVLVFARTRHGAERLSTQLKKEDIPAAAIHGDKSQANRQQALRGFKTSRIRVLIATDVASRGIDVEGITHVINFDIPGDPETYVHRIGRTGRAGAGGAAYSFCEPTELAYWLDIQALPEIRIELERQHPFHDQEILKALEKARMPKQGKSTAGKKDGNKKSAKKKKRSNRPDQKGKPRKSVNEQTGDRFSAEPAQDRSRQAAGESPAEKKPRPKQAAAKKTAAKKSSANKPAPGKAAGKSAPGKSAGKRTADKKTGDQQTAGKHTAKNKGRKPGAEPASSHDSLKRRPLRGRKKRD